MMVLSSFEPGIARKPMVSLVIPTLNEAKNLPLVLPYIPLDTVDEVLLIDGRSTDNTIGIARQILPSIKIVSETRPGKGAAMRRGYSEAAGDIIVVLDADGSHDPREIPRFVNALVQGADFVKGSRFSTTGGTTDMPRLRQVGNWSLTRMVNLLFAQSFSDLCYGYHAFWRRCLDYLDLEAVDGFEVDTAIYLQAVRARLKVTEVPSFEGGRFYGVGKLQTFPDGWRVLNTIIKEWQMAWLQPAPEPQVGFYSNRLIDFSSQSAGPAAGWLAPARDEPPEIEHAAERMRCNLEEFFSTVLPETPREGVEPLLSTVLFEVMEQNGASSGSLLIFDQKLPGGHSYRVFGRKMEIIPFHEIRDILQGGSAGWVIQNREPLLIEHTTSDPRWLPKPWEQQEGISRSVVAVPFFKDGRLISVLTMSRPDERCFSQAELSRIKGIQISI